MFFRSSFHYMWRLSLLPIGQSIFLLIYFSFFFFSYSIVLFFLCLARSPLLFPIAAWDVNHSAKKIDQRLMRKADDSKVEIYTVRSAIAGKLIDFDRVLLELAKCTTVEKELDVCMRKVRSIRKKHYMSRNVR